MKVKRKQIKSLLLILLLLTMPVQAKHLHKEQVYENYFCGKLGGTTEYYLLDKSRVDCITDKYAIEFEFAYLAIRVNKK